MPACGCARTTTTDANGDYAFCDVGPGSYNLVECQPAGYCDGLRRQGRGRHPRVQPDRLHLHRNVCGCYDLRDNTFGEVV